MSKTISVVMCTYNGERFLREQMDSILAQTYPIMEIIVQDDCSTDGTVGIVRKYMEKNGNIHLFINKHNLGFNLNFQTATMRAKGDFVAFADQDDVWFPHKIERLIEWIGGHSICFCDVLRGGEKEKSKRTNYKFSFEALLFKSIVGHAMLLKRDFAHDKRNWNLWRIYDWSLALAAHAYGNGIAKVDEPLVWHRMHEGEVTAPKQGTATRPKAWQPYLYGWKTYRKLQESAYWQETYSSINKLCAKNSLANKITRCLLSRKTSGLLRLCFLCMAHKDIIYPGNAKGLKGCLRGFFFPSIFAYFNEGEFTNEI